jgi:hypothetical protein
MRRRVTHIDPLSASRVLGLLLFVQGFILGVIAVILKLAGISLPLDVLAMPGATTITMLLYFPLTIGSIGVLSGALLAYAYNWVAKRFGGLEYEMEQAK